MPATNQMEPEGGDPPCWTHLFDDAADADEEPVWAAQDPRLTSRPCDGAIDQDRTD